MSWTTDEAKSEVSRLATTGGPLAAVAKVVKYILCCLIPNLAYAFGAAIPGADDAIAGDKTAFHLPIGLTVSELQASVEIAPVGSDLTVIFRDGIGGTAIGTVTILDGATTGVLAITAQAFAAMDQIEAEVVLIGSGTAGGHVKVSVTGIA